MAIRLTPSEEMKHAAKTLQGAKLNIRVELADRGEEVTVPDSLVQLVQEADRDL